MPMLHTICMDIRFNRQVNPDKDFVSPGGYEMVIDGKSVRFDFTNYEGNVDKSDSSIVHMEATWLDTETFPESAKITKKMMKNITKISEFFVYTGEADETDLQPVELLAVTLYDDKGNPYNIPQFVLRKAELCCCV